MYDDIRYPLAAIHPLTTMEEYNTVPTQTGTATIDDAQSSRLQFRSKAHAILSMTRLHGTHQKVAMH